MTNFLQNNNRKLIKSFYGYASVFNYVDVHMDVILPGAFDLGNDPPLPFLWQHDYKKPIGKVTAYCSDKMGLMVQGVIFLELKQAAEAEILIANAVTAHLSIGFEAVDYHYEDNIRFISAVKLYEVSVVTFPANNRTNVNIMDECEHLQLALGKANRALAMHNGG